jgi:hypothetical protein
VKVDPFFGGIRGVILFALLDWDGKEYLALNGTTTSSDDGYHLK